MQQAPLCSRRPCRPCAVQAVTGAHSTLAPLMRVQGVASCPDGQCCSILGLCTADPAMCSAWACDPELSGRGSACHRERCASGRVRLPPLSRSARPLPSCPPTTSARSPRHQDPAVRPHNALGVARSRRLPPPRHHHQLEWVSRAPARRCQPCSRSCARLCADAPLMQERSTRPSTRFLHDRLCPAVFPGPTLHCQVGDRLVVRVTNSLGEPITIHWWAGAGAGCCCWAALLPCPPPSAALPWPPWPKRGPPPLLQARHPAARQRHNGWRAGGDSGALPQLFGPRAVQRWGVAPALPEVAAFAPRCPALPLHTPSTLPPPLQLDLEHGSSQLYNFICPVAGIYW